MHMKKYISINICVYLHRHAVTHHVCLLSDLAYIISIILHEYIYKAQFRELQNHKRLRQAYRLGL